jgi:hypothetical protein
MKHGFFASRVNLCKVCSRIARHGLAARHVLIQDGDLSSRGAQCSDSRRTQSGSAPAHNGRHCVVNIHQESPKLYRSESTLSTHDAYVAAQRQSIFTVECHSIIYTKSMQSKTVELDLENGAGISFSHSTQNTCLPISASIVTF